MFVFKLFFLCYKNKDIMRRGVERMRRGVERRRRGLERRRRGLERRGEEEKEETRRGEGWSYSAVLWVVGQAGWWVILGFKRILIKHTEDRYVG